MELVNPVPVERGPSPGCATFATTLLGTPWDDEFAAPGRATGGGRGTRAQLGRARPRALGGHPGDRPAHDHRPRPGRQRPSTSTADALTGSHGGRDAPAARAAARDDHPVAAAAVDRGDALAILIAAEWPIYGRFGYAPASASADYTSPPAPGRRGDVAPTRPARVRQVEPAELGDVRARASSTARPAGAGRVRSTAAAVVGAAARPRRLRADAARARHMDRARGRRTARTACSAGRSTQRLRARRRPWARSRWSTLVDRLRHSPTATCGRTCPGSTWSTRSR